jgi:hypothetical protein
MVRPGTSYWLAMIAALDGREDEALSRLERAWSEGFRGQYFSGDPDEAPAFAGLRRQPRYQAVRSRLLSYLEKERRQVLAGSAKPSEPRRVALPTA